MERDEQDRVVAADDRLGAVSVMHVPVDDRDTLDAELRLRVTCRDDGVGEDAEAHRPIGERVVARRPHEREAAHLDGAHGAPCREPCRLPGGRLADRVAVEPALVREGRDAGDVVGVVGALDRGRRRSPPFELGSERCDEAEQALLRLRVMVVSGRVEVGHRRMGDGLHGYATSRSLAARRSHPQLLRCPRAGGPVGLEIRQVGQRRGRIEGRDPAERAELRRFRLEPAGRDHRLEIGVGLEQRGGGLLAHASRSRDLVRGIATERDEVAHLARVDAVPLPYLGRADPGQLADAADGLQDRDVGRCELERVAVGGRDERAAAAQPSRPRRRPRGSRPPRSHRAWRRRSRWRRREPAGARAGRRSRGRTRARTGTSRAARSGRWARRACPRRRRPRGVARPARGAAAST